MNTIFVSGKPITFYMYNVLMTFLAEKVSEGCTLLQEENDESEAHSLQWGNGLYSILEMGKNDDIFFAFSGAWDVSPHFERNLAFHYGVFKTPECRGNVKFPIGNPTKNFADSTRFRRIAEGLYNAAKGIAEKKLDDVFYMIDGNEVLFVEGGSTLYITHDNTNQLLSVCRVGDFEYFSERYSTILEFGGVSFYAPETDDAE